MIEGRQARTGLRAGHRNGRARVKLSDFRGQPVVLYFYPKDDSLPPFDSMSA